MNLNKKVLLAGLSAVLGLVSLDAVVTISAKAALVEQHYYATTTRATGGLPKNTRVSVAYTTRKNGKAYVAIEASRLSYKLRKAIGNKTSLLISATAITAGKPVVSDLLPVLVKGAKFTDTANFANQNRLKMTTNGYLELYKNKTNRAPISSTKITASRIKGTVTYLYSKTNMAKLPDKHIRKTGNYQYRLAIRDNQKQMDLSRSYSVGTLKNLFYEPTLKA